MADAWGLAYTANYPAAYVTAKTPPGSPGAFVSMQDIVSYEVSHVTNGDKFHIIDGNDDFVDTWFWSMYPNGQFPTGYTGGSSVSAGQSQILTKFGPSVFWQVNVDGSGIGTLAGAIPWYKHHGFLGDDTSTWSNQLIGGLGSGVASFLASIAPAGGW
jgi:hypothetical protein